MAYDDSTTYCIYRIVNFQNGKVYVGLTDNYKRRKTEHLAELRHEKHCNPHLQNAFNKYGEGAFYFEVLEKNIHRNSVLDREKHWVQFFNSYHNGYNRTVGGDERSDVQRSCEWNGVQYSSVKAAAKAIGITANTLQRRLWKGQVADSEVKPHEKPISYNGVEYPSISAAARAHNITFTSMWHRIQKGYTNDSNLKDNRVPVIVDGVQYPSITAAAKAYGIVPNSMRKRLKKIQNGTNR